MKKIIAALLCCIMVTLTFAGCKGKSASKVKTAKKQTSDNCEDAFIEMFDTMYGSTKVGRIFFEYMYPDAALDKMKADGTYESRIATYDKSHDKFINDAKYAAKVNTVTEKKAMTESQLKAAALYLVNLSKEFLPGFSADELNITEGYSLTCDITDFNKNAATERGCVVKIDGKWKIIAMDAESLEKSFPELAK